MRFKALSLLLLYSIVTINAFESGCQLCEETGDCSAAFHNMPGQYCGRYFNYVGQRFPCCCPLNSICRVYNSGCRCHVQRPPRYVRHAPPTAHDTDFLSSLVFVAILATCCFFCCCKERSYRESRDVPSAPYYQSTYPVAEAIPTAYCAPERSETSYGSAAVGAGLGFLAGTAVGSAISSHRQNDYRYDADDGGYDIPGDSGDSGYDISGDS